MLCIWASSPAFASATHHLTLATPVQSYWFFSSASALLKSHLCFPWRCMYCSLYLQSFSLNLYISKPGTSFLELSPPIPPVSSWFLSLPSVPLLYLGHRSLVALTFICSYFPHTFAFWTRLSSLGAGIVSYYSRVPSTQDSILVHLELKFRK